MSQRPFSQDAGGPSRTDATGRDRVEEASAESFPASDPPAWAAGSEPPVEPPCDQRSALLRASTGGRVCFEYETGACIAGVVLAVRPARGPVEFVVLADAEITDQDGSMIEEHERLVICVGVMTHFDNAERGQGRDLRFPGSHPHP